MYNLISYLLIIGFISCSASERQFEVPKDLIGKWTSSNTKITVRTQNGFNDFDFSHGEIDISLVFNDDKSVAGSIGDYEISNGKLAKDKIYKINLDEVGKLFKDDPLDYKDIIIWIHSISEDEMAVVIRQKDNGGKFPMAELILIKEE